VDLSPLLLFTLIGYLLGIALRLLLLLMHVCFLLLMNTLLPVALASFNEDKRTYTHTHTPKKNEERISADISDVRRRVFVICV
jgi:hypothetical protein